jgi:ABC-type polysaccharide/polyol phosphate export permease
MKHTTTTLREYIMPVIIVASFLAYYFDLFKDGMMISGVFAVVIMVYIGIIWQEKVHDERDEYIRSKVDRYLYILTLVLIFIDIIHKTFSHQSYMDGVVILTILSLAKVILSKTISNQS